MTSLHRALHLVRTAVLARAPIHPNHHHLALHGRRDQDIRHRTEEDLTDKTITRQIIKMIRLVARCNLTTKIQKTMVLHASKARALIVEVSQPLREWQIRLK